MRRLGKIRVLMVKIGLDGHWRGAISVSHLLRDAGMEVIFAGFQGIEGIIQTAIQEDVDIIGLSIHSGAHIDWTKKMMDRLREKGLSDKFIMMVGGAIPVYDVDELKKMGVCEVFSPGVLPGKIIRAFKESAANKRD
jgi:methylmalonyl-CoA mutase C-terminal domain/subunit